jgi:hypothetical protein
MMTTTQRRALFNTIADPDSTEQAKEACQRALARDMEEQREAQRVAYEHWLETYEPYDENDRITFERTKRTRVQQGNASVPYGWNKRVDGLIDEIYILDPDATFSQFKSKFGGLRVYGTFNPAAERAIRQAEIDCESICFWCGNYADERWNMEPVCNDHKKGAFDPRDSY